jgi:hypothetical protein
MEAHAHRPADNVRPSVGTLVPPDTSGPATYHCDMSSRDERFVTVVSGLPRSGTSMMMMMVEAGGMSVLTDQVRGPDEDNPKGYYEFEPVKATRSDPSWVQGAAGKAVKIVHILLFELPPTNRYRVILMRRDLAEVLASQAAMLRRGGRSGADLSPQRLGEIFEAQLQRVVQWADREENVDLLEVSYADVLRRPLEEAARVNEHLGAALDVDAMAAAVDPKLHRQRS